MIHMSGEYRHIWRRRLWADNCEFVHEPRTLLVPWTLLQPPVSLNKEMLGIAEDDPILTSPHFITYKLMISLFSCNPPPAIDVPTLAGFCKSIGPEWLIPGRIITT